MVKVHAYKHICMVSSLLEKKHSIHRFMVQYLDSNITQYNLVIALLSQKYFPGIKYLGI